MSSDIASFARRRERDCHIAKRALEKWLAVLNPIRWVMVTATTILSALAAASILGKASLLGVHYETFAGLCALGAAILSGLHTSLRCDPHQTECRNLIAEYDGLEAAFQSVPILEEPKNSAKLADLETKYEQIRSTARVTAPAYFLRNAEKEWDSAKR
jgi:aspartyl/asparaginyl beta-hydroxylase (cupin superfamily)